MSYTISQNLNIRPKYFPHVVVHVSAGDANIPVHFSIYDGASTYTIPSGTTITVHGYRKDGGNWITNGTYSGNVVSFTLPRAAMAIEGAGIADVVFTTGTEVVGSANFCLLVERATFPNGVTYSNDSSVFQDLLNFVNSSAVPEAISDWLEENITATSPAVDASLTVQGAAADAKATGDALANRVVTQASLSGNVVSFKNANNSEKFTIDLSALDDIKTVTSMDQMTDHSAVYMYTWTENMDVHNQLYFYNGEWTPLGSGVRTASTASQMTDTNAIYKYTGSETGYERNALYYYNGTEWTYIGAGSAELPLNYAPIEFTTVDGWISTSLSIYDQSPRKHIALSVTGGEKYAVTGGGVNSNYPCAFVVDANNTVTVLLATGHFFNEVITVPNGSVYLYVNYNISYDCLGIQSATRMQQQEFNEKIEKVTWQKPNLKVLCGDGVISIKRKYDSEKDIMVKLGNTGGNNLFNFLSLTFVANTGKEPNDQFVGYTDIQGWTLNGSDWFGPYVVAAKNNINGDWPNSGYFTGGSHQTNNLGTGGEKTADQTSYSVLINGIEEPTIGVSYSCETVVVRWTNLVQAYNTTKSDGNGRGVLTESWEAVIDNDRIKLKNHISALEDITIRTYYGFQMTNPSNSRYWFIGGSNRGVYTALSGAGATDSGNKTCRAAVLGNDNCKCEVGVDPVDLGLFEHIGSDSSSFFTSNGKLYSNLIRAGESGGSALDLDEGESCFLSGYYRFY